MERLNATESVTKTRSGDHLYNYQDGTLVDDPQQILQHINGDSNRMVYILHENYLSFVDDLACVDQLATVFAEADHLSRWIDGAGSRTMDLQTECAVMCSAFAIGALKRELLPPSWRPIRFATLP